MTPERSSGQPEGKVEPKHTSAQEPQSDAWLKTELARNVRRPYPMDFIRTIFVDLSEIHGDRNFADDPAMQCAKGELGDLTDQRDRRRGKIIAS